MAAPFISEGVLDSMMRTKREQKIRQKVPAWNAGQAAQNTIHPSAKVILAARKAKKRLFFG
jgi:hypothetical protein